MAANGTKGVVDSAKSLSAGYVSDSAEKWLNQFGTARVQLNVDDNGNWDDSSFDFLAPVYNTEQQMFFTQLGLRAPDGRITGNLGMGVRAFTADNWMFGGNIFLDDDFTGKNRRVGLGAEAWTDNLKLSANSYIGTTDWHQSRDFDDYNEKPADGFDVRAEGYLPSYPQLGAKLMYEQYYGDDVALFDKDHLQDDPSSVTLGINYTPIPLLTFGVEYKRGQDSLDDTQFSMNFRYNIGRPWQEQISPAQVAVQRSLAGSRYDLVERNNTIVMAYKKKSVSNSLANMTLVINKDGSPADGLSMNTASVQATTSDGLPVRNAVIDWSVTGTAQLSPSTTTTDENGNATVNITNKTAEQVIVQATSGSVTKTATTSFIPSADLSLAITKNNSKADGNDANTGQVTVKDANGKAMPEVAITWSTDNGAVITDSQSKTDGQGQATVKFTNQKEGAVMLSASADGQTETVPSGFINDDTAAAIDVTMTTNHQPADNTSLDVAQAIVTNASHQPIVGAVVTWNLSGSSTASAATPLTATTDENGISTLVIKDSVAENVTISASSGELSGSTTATFDTVKTEIVLEMIKNNAIIDGVDQDIAQVTVTKGGVPLSNVVIAWDKTSLTAKNAKAPQELTNKSGQATLAMTDKVAETFTVTALVNGETFSTSATFVQPDFGPITLDLPEADAQALGGVPLINWEVSQGGTPVVISNYAGMAAGDTIDINFSVTGAADGSPHAYVAPTYTVRQEDMGTDISIIIPETTLANIEGENQEGGGAPLPKYKIDAKVTKPEIKSLSATTTGSIDTLGAH
ncbi:inverse autotransporter beta domain-containing protein [Edaphovirga cremea]|uniref:inverse autotransporter beta domain-containing protein n=1 Tax=Edaphovirga cremea TaxID=2267246 RepID=UPI003989FF26